MGILLLDSSTSAAAATSPYARLLESLLPPGRLWRLYAGAVLPKLLAGLADELQRVADRGAALLSEADPSTAVELLPEYEAELGIAAAATVAERQARVVGRLVARQRYRPVDFQTALAPLLAQDPGDVVVLERTLAFAATVGDAREIFRFFIYRNPALPGAYFLAGAQALVNQIKPAHTIGTLIESVSFLCDDPFSLCDRDLLGA